MTRSRLDAAGAKAIVDLLSPHLVIPMHYATPAVNFLQPVDLFLRLMSRWRRRDRPRWRSHQKM